MDLIKNIRFDAELGIEAYRFVGMAQEFPNHFHEYYVIGLIEFGERRLNVDRREYNIGPGDLLTFNPLESHACEQTDGGGLSYRALNIKRDIMADFVREISGRDGLPYFQSPVQFQTHLAGVFSELHDGLMSGAAGLEKEELFLLFMEQVLSCYSELTDDRKPRTNREDVEKVCAYLQAHYAERVSLDILGEIAGLNKYTLLRNFTRWKGITPYRYLETIRIGQAKVLLERGLEPADVAQRTGFSDQSHLTTYFNKIIGLTPGQYKSVFIGDAERGNE